MAQALFQAELVTAQERRLHWQEEYAKAVAANDGEHAAKALQHVNRYEWLIALIEGTRNASDADTLGKV